MSRAAFASLALLVLAAGAPGRERADLLGDPLPRRAVARLGTHRLCCVNLGGMALAADGSALAALDAYLGELTVWDLPSGRPRWRASLPPLGQFSPGNDRLAFSPDGKKLALNHEKGGLRLWEASTGRLLHALGEPSESGRVAFSPDGRKLASSRWADVEVWDVATGKRLAGWEVEGWANPLAWSADGRTLVLADHPYEGGHATRVCLWDAVRGKRLRVWRAPKGGASALSPDGKRFALLVGGGKRLLVQDAATGRELFRASATVELGAPVFSGDGRALACAGADGVLHVWGVPAGKLLRSVALGRGDAYSVVLSADGNTAAFTTGFDQALQVRDLRKGRPPARFPGHTLGPLHVAFSADGKEVVTAAEDSVVRSSGLYTPWALRRWDASTGKERLAVSRDLGGRVEEVVLSGDGRYAGVVLPDFTLRLWDARRGRELRRWRLPTHDVHTGPGGKKERTRAVHAFAFSPDGRELLAVGKELYRWDVETGKELPPFGLLFSRIVSLPHSRLQNEDWLPVETSSFSGFQLVSVRTGRAGPRVPAPLPRLWDFSLSADGRTLAALEGGRVSLWEVASGAPRGEVGGVAKRFGRLALSPDGRLLACPAANDREVLLWDLAAGQARAVLAGHKDRVVSLAFSPDGTRLATGAGDNVAYVWDVTGEGPASKLSGEELESLWADLHSPDGAAAFRAVWRLAGDPARSVRFLRRRLRARGEEDARVARLIGRLDDDNFRAREAANGELARLGARALPGLARAMKGEPSPEARHRIARLLRRFPAGVVPSARLVGSRVIEALEKSRSPAARAALEELGKEEVWRDEARAALRRLRR